jgi:hypothetical protein
MKKVVMMLVLGFLSALGAAHASEPDCTPQEEGAKAAALAKPDLSKCGDLRGKDKKKCEAEARNLTKRNFAVANRALACCKNPSSCK